MKRRRVVVTGMGVVSPLGVTITEYWQNAIQGKSGVKPISNFPIPDNLSAIAGIVDDFYPDSMRIDLPYEGYDRTTLFALHAANAALKQAGLANLAAYETRCALMLSSAVGQIIGMERVFRQRTKHGKLKIADKYQDKSNPFKFNNLTDEVALELGIKGKAILLPTGCAGGVDAIAHGIHTIRNQQADIVLVGGCEAPITPLVVAAFGKISATTNRYNEEPQKASRPFDRDRDGFVLGEGCGMLILEEREAALKRGATILAEFSGTGSVNNCYHMTDIPASGKPIANASLAALFDANVQPDQINFINAHGSSTPQNDIAETNAYKIIFNKKYNRIPVTSNKSILGHALAASNALEVILSILSLHHQIIPPTINLDNQDELCTIDVVGNVARNAAVNCVLKTSSGFSGIHSSLVIQKYGEAS